MRKQLLAIAISGTMFPIMANATGLGAIKVMSNLNQPLRAEVKLFSTQGMPVEDIKAKLASAADFSRVGMQRSYALTKLNFEVARDKNGLPVVKISTVNPVKDPFVNFLLDLQWPQGEVFRQYTILLDPPQYTQIAAVNDNQPVSQHVQPQLLNAPQQVPSAQELAPQKFYRPVEKFDTLSSIAIDVRPNHQVSTDQTMVAILEANPKAFFDHNINRMKMGYTLRIPNEDEIKQVPHQQAVNIVVQQNTAWREWRHGERDNSDTGFRAQFAIKQQIKYVQPSNRQVRQANEVHPVSLSMSETPAELESNFLVDPIQQSNTDKALRAELALSTEALIHQRDQNQALQLQLQNLEQELLNVKQVLSAKDHDLLKLQRHLSSKDREVLGIQQKITELQTEVTNSSTGNLNASVGSETLTGSGMRLSSTSQGSGSDLLTQSSWWLNLLAALAVVGGVIGARTWWQRYRYTDGVELVIDEPEVQHEEVESSQVEKQAVVEETQQPAPAKSEAIAHRLVDPIEEANVYLTYNRYSEAEGVLQSGLELEPERTDLKVKLMELYTLIKDRQSFEQYQQQLPGNLDLVDPLLFEKLKSFDATIWQEETQTESSDEENVTCDNDDSSHVIEFETDTQSDSVSDLASEDPISTQLDLAHVYLNMQNFEDAKKVLLEVINNGTAEQKAEAEKLMQRISE